MNPLQLIAVVDEVGMLRQHRMAREPDPVHFALQAEMAGAAGVRAHLRLDRRHILEPEIELFNRLLKSEFYLQVSPHQEVQHLINAVRPRCLVLCAERREERSTENGLDVALLCGEIQLLLRNTDSRQTRTFLYVDPVLEQIKAAAKIGVHGLVLNLRELIGDRLSSSYKKKLQELRDAVRLTVKFGMVAHVSGGATSAMLADLRDIEELSAVHIGHQLVARALMEGVVPSVQHLLTLLAR